MKTIKLLLGILALQLAVMSCNSQAEKQKQISEDDMASSKTEAINDLVKTGVSEEEAEKQVNAMLRQVADKQRLDSLEAAHVKR